MAEGCPNPDSETERPVSRGQGIADVPEPCQIRISPWAYGQSGMLWHHGLGQSFLPAMHPAHASTHTTNGSFDRESLFTDPDAYRTWRESKLSDYSQAAFGHFIDIENPWVLTADEKRELSQSANRHNFALYRFDLQQYGSWEPVHALCTQMGLCTTIANPLSDRHDVSALYDRTGESGSRDRRYIPYSPRPLNWHTDGYYAEGAEMVRSFVLHCEREAERGGENSLIDHEMVYLRLRDRHPELAEALTRPDVMTIPENRQDGKCIRGCFRGPVFSRDPVTGCLYMRYTQRKHNIHWCDDARIASALDALDRILDTELPEKLTVRLSPGQGILCNNILHRRTAYTDGKGPAAGRLFYRIRYCERMQQSAD